MKRSPLLQFLILLSTFPLFYVYFYSLHIEYYEPRIIIKDTPKESNEYLQESKDFKKEFPNLAGRNFILESVDPKIDYDRSNKTRGTSNNKFNSTKRKLNYERDNSNKINGGIDTERDRDSAKQTNLETASKIPKVNRNVLDVNFSHQNQDGRKLINLIKIIDDSVNAKPLDGTEQESFLNEKVERIANHSALQLDFDRRQWHTWTKDSKCKDYVVRFTVPNSRPICALASFPGSGNTWFRYLIEASSGTFTSSIYDDAQLFMWGYLGEIESVTAGTTLVQKLHTASLSTVQEFNRTAILIVRNPYRAILSYHNFLFGGHKAYAPVFNYRRRDWPAFVHLQLRRWLELIIIWVKEGRRILVIHYENLQEDPMREIKRALDFLEVPVDEGRLNCVQDDLGKTLKRKKEVFPSNLEIFPNVTSDKMDRAIRYVSFLLQKHGHQTPPLHLYEFYNGSSSGKIDFIPCEQNETIIECDDRIDELNMATRVLDFHHIEKESTPSSEVSTKVPQKLSAEVTKQRNNFDDENVIGLPKKPTKKARKPFKFEKSTIHKIETTLLMFGAKLLEFVTESPVKKLLATDIFNTTLDINLQL